MDLIETLRSIGAVRVELPHTHHAFRAVLPTRMDAAVAMPSRQNSRTSAFLEVLDLNIVVANEVGYQRQLSADFAVVNLSSCRGNSMTNKLRHILIAAQAGRY